MHNWLVGVAIATLVRAERRVRAGEMGMQIDAIDCLTMMAALLIVYP
jgi:hypothetical protein